MKVAVLYRVGSREYGNTVCVVKRSDSSSLYLRWYSGGSPVYKSVEHADLKVAQDEADDVAKILRRGGAPGKDAPVTLAEVIAGFERAKHKPRLGPGGKMLPPEKKERQITADVHRGALFVEFFTATREALTVDADAMQSYVSWRRSQKISDTTIGHEIVYLKGVFEWARKKRLSNGRRLLEENPIEDVARIRSADPHTPVASEEAFRAVFRFSDRVCGQKLFRPFLMLVHEHGWRLSAWCNLLMSDVDLKPGRLYPYGRIRKRTENDKKRKGGWKPLTPRSARAVRLLLRRRRAIGDVLAFPAPKARGENRELLPWQPQFALELLHRAEGLATESARRRELIEEDESIVLGGFHALRRKWGTDRKDMPLVDVAEAGDWAPATLLGHYQKPDAATTLRVTLRGAK